MDNLDFSKLPIFPTILLCIAVIYFFYGVVKYILFGIEGIKLKNDMKKVNQDLKSYIKEEERKSLQPEEKMTLKRLKMILRNGKQKSSEGVEVVEVKKGFKA